MKSIDPTTCIEDALSLLATELEPIAIERSYGPLPSLTCQPGDLNQVFMHVLRNAAQAGAKTIAIRAEAIASGVAVTITDDGKGMSTETVSRIFDPTFSSDGRRVKVGFGLSASLGIVEDHGGSIEIDSALGRGTTVRVVIRPILPEGR